uniref:Fucolectin tachylectin-4 pentraxin-1 domain-containing protein n=1 Tax=Strigamia maritima TaxID=126957 RepID=T1JJF6_STRMM
MSVQSSVKSTLGIEEDHSKRNKKILIIVVVILLLLLLIIALIIGYVIGTKLKKCPKEKVRKLSDITADKEVLTGKDGSKGKVTQSTSTRKGGGPKAAIDNAWTNRDWGSSQCVATSGSAEDHYPWVMIELDKESIVFNVKLWRTKATRDENNKKQVIIYDNLEVRVGNINEVALIKGKSDGFYRNGMCKAFVGEPVWGADGSLAITCQKNQIGKYVTIQIGFQFTCKCTFLLCEVQLFGKAL